MAEITYQSGFGNHFETEAEEGALPKGKNSPQKAALGLYPEQVNGTSFLASREENLRSWFYRIQPSVVHSPFAAIEHPHLNKTTVDSRIALPDQIRWNPIEIPKEKTDFIDGIHTICSNGTESSVRGSAVHIYTANQDMGDKFFYDADAELLIVPEKGALRIDTECGIIEASPLDIVVIPRGIKFQVSLPDGTARGYICENFGPHLRLPYLGPIGSNGLANPRDFLAPQASYKNEKGDFSLIAKFQGNLFESKLKHNPLDVVAWHGNYYPYKYDLKNFVVINTVSVDHPDPSIFTVLTSPSELPGISNIDFVIFPPRWMVAEETFRPPYYHRNFMSEYMGLIKGVYDAKEEGFVPGGASLHNCMTAHGPDADTFEKASNAKLGPTKIEDTMAFMFESSLVYKPTEFALNSKFKQKNYLDCWQGLKNNFSKAMQPTK